MRPSLHPAGVLVLSFVVGIAPAGCGRDDTSPQPPSREQARRAPAPIQAAPPASSPQPARESPARTPLSPAQAWALATSGVLWERNRDRHDTLGGMEPTAENINRIKQVLSQWWDITSRDTLLEQLEGLDGGGHRREFEEMGPYVESLSGERYREVVARAQQNEELSHRMQIVKQHYGALGRKSLLGWDYARYVFLCRWGYFVGYLTEEEAWDRIMPVAGMLQRTFESWKDLGENYLVGREFWSLAQTKRDGDLYRESYQRLLTDPASPWNRYPWNLDLGPSATRVRSSGSVKGD